MNYGFIIDQRKCIGCHACTTACKSENQVPLGVNRTWVKQVEKGEFPNSRRLFTVMRCNHCADAPCVEICPVEALFIRDDGIVDFDNNRCIGCKSCMQACPYDALFIDPETNTASKCNYCAHRVDIGLEPACVNVCPEHAIISGDMDDPESEISQLMSRQQLQVRKPEKGTNPKLFYIDADDLSLSPSKTERSNSYFWSSQSLGVGHYAREAEKMANSNLDLVSEVLRSGSTPNDKVSSDKVRSVEVLMNKSKRVYDSPNKGILWGWEVSSYITTKAVASGLFLIAFIAYVSGIISFSSDLVWVGMIISTVFLLLTGALLILDLDRPDRFLYVLFRPQWKSWLVRGGYIITIFGAVLALSGVASFLELNLDWIMWPGAIVAVLTSIYTAFLFAQAKGRDFWQSPLLSFHMFIHSLLAGGALYLFFQFFIPFNTDWMQLLRNILIIGLCLNLLAIAIELITPHPTSDANETVQSIVKGEYKIHFWFATILSGNVIPLILLFVSGNTLLTVISAIFILAGIYFTQHIWVRAPQKIPLS